MAVLPDVLPAGIAAVLHIGSFVLALSFVFANRAVVGLPVLALGGLCNMVAIATNGGVMPASPTALRVAGLAGRTPDGFRNSAAVRHPRLAWLGDVFAIPKDWPFANVFSVGDALLIVGATILVHSICHARLATQEQTA